MVYGKAADLEDGACHGVSDDRSKWWC